MSANILRISPPARPGDAEITPVMVDAVRKRIVDAGGTLTVWAILHQDLYEAKHGDDDDGDEASRPGVLSALASVLSIK